MRTPKTVPRAAPPAALDADFARRQFPAGLWEWAFFENAGGSFAPQAVIDRMTAYMSGSRVQPGYPSAPSLEAAARIDAARCRAARMIGAEADEMVIGASTSINVYVLARALGARWAPGDEVLVSALNHEANSGPWRRLARDGLKVVDWPVTAEAAPDMDALERLLNERTRLVAFPHVSNITGGINDAAAIAARAHAAGARVCVDGVAAAPHRAVDVKALDADFYLLSFYKVFGPHLGGLYGRRGRLLEAEGQSHYFFERDDAARGLNPAGPCHESIAALAGVADYFEALAERHLDPPPEDFRARVAALYGLFAEHEERLAARFMDFARSKRRLRLIGPASHDRGARVPTFSFLVEGMASAALPEALARERVAVASGHFYARRLLERLGVADPDDGVVRCSMAHYNTLEEVDRLTAALDRAIPS